MTIVERRVFYGRIGNGEPLINHIEEGNALAQRYGAGLKSRVLSDYNSGRTDRVVVEWEVEKPEDIEAAFNQVMTNPEGRAEFEKWVARLNELIHYAKVEHWAVH